ncbi:N-acetylmuramoyl-L-alanine amidase-like domain-containing protein [Candidatus Palauibacter sp.]|uniref:N-acetylmuramoyl-L-alanine amidase-like domain-containing protein n=1 Tax=Candidatus Palauibacter sp. TaxID=3101350 RepID=UPI003AF211B8
MNARNALTLAKVTATILVTVVAIAVLTSWPIQPPTSTVVDETAGVGAESAAAAGEAAWAAEDWAVFEEKVRFADERGLADMELGEAIVRLAESFIGTTYEPGTLEVPGPERLVINFRELDCVTLVETVLALTRFVREGRAEALADPRAAQARYEANLMALRYRGGLLDGYASRLHYFSEWLADNESRGLLRVVTGELDPSADPEPARFMSEHPGAYRQLANPGVLEAITAIEERLDEGPDRLYVPQDRIAQVTDRIRNGDVIAATSTVAGLDVAHTGFAVWRDGALHLLHAPLVGRSVEISARPLSDRILSIDSQDGIMVARPVEPPR